jgi:hypothetical protein
MNESRRLVSDDLRHASSGPTPVRNSRTKPIGTIHLLKNGAATVSRSPVTASRNVGNMVANRTNSAENSSTQLLTMNAASRDIHESSSLRAFRSGSRQMTSPKLTVRIRIMKPVNSRASTGSSPNACTDCTTPERVMNVPKIVMKNVMITSVTFHTRSMLRRSCTITEWRKAVAVNQGSSPAFSTGSHAQ